jgi:hypothetical protein
MKRAIIIAFGIVIIIAAGVAVKERYFAHERGYDWTVGGPQPQPCTMEAKVCPDGTTVGRTGPNCEFPSCPKPAQPPVEEKPIFEGDVEADMGVGDGSQLSAEGRSCISQGGTWDPQYDECVGVRPAQCEAIGGEYNECASACRHNPGAEACTLQCVQVCQL